jgi:F-type H+-transporting ATPase subunit a
MADVFKSTRVKVILAFSIFLTVLGIFIALYGWARKDNNDFQPPNEFKLDKWISLPLGLDFNKAVMYLLIAAILTVVTMVYVARRMQERPNRVQTAIEVLFTTMRDTITRGSMDDAMAVKWFPFIGAIFLFIWYSNLIGFIPLPTNTENTFTLFGQNIPSFAIYAATANISIPLALALYVWVAYNWEGIRAKGFIGYLKAFVPKGVHGPMVLLIFPLEIMSNFMRLISLSVRLFANMLAGHLIILFMGGALVVLLGIPALGVITFIPAVLIYLFEVGLVATLQAFIFATLTAIYLGGAVAEDH